MKKYAIILLILGLIGLTLTIQFFNQDQKLDQTVFLQTTESIRKLQTLDKNLRLLLNQSRFNSRFDHHQLRDTNFELSIEFDNLRFDALFEEIENSSKLSQTVSAFEQAFTSRDELLERYIIANTQITESLLAVNRVYHSLQTNNQIKQQSALYASIAKIQSDLFNLTLGGGLSGGLELLEPEFEIPLAISKKMAEHKAAVKQILVQYPVADALYQDLLAINTDQLLNQIESDYADYHNSAIAGSNALGGALLGYGVTLLLALIFFGYTIWRNYALLEQQVADRTEEIKNAYEELRESRELLIQNEKMASLGQMVAGVAHEINTPLGYVTSNVGALKLNVSDLGELTSKLHQLSAELSADQPDSSSISTLTAELVKIYTELEANELIDESQQLLDDGIFGLQEISKLVVSLKDFSRLDRQAIESIDIHNCLESSLTIASNPIKENDVSVVREFAELPKITCSPSKLNQLFLNIITNACQAMHEQTGSLTIRTSSDNDEVRIDFIDQGIGMDEQTRQKMFDPFFTSKEIGQGTGLGMSIAYKIIEAHSGRIDVSSILNQGTTVSVILPANAVLT
ncbi:MAG: signal transduction histidine kinase [Arenicella sp.]|jgi:signal transduction histidine kinase